MQRLQEIEGHLKEANESIDEAERRRRQVDDSRKAITEAGVKYQRACVPAVLVHMMLRPKREAPCSMDPVERDDNALINWFCSSSDGSSRCRGADVAMQVGARSAHNSR